MDTIHLDGSSVSPEGLEQSFKRQKLDTSITSNLNDLVVPLILDSERERKRSKTEIMTLRTRLSESEATVTKLHRIRREIEEIFDKERIMLQRQVKADTEMIEELRVELDKATRSTHEALEAKQSVETEMSQMISQLLMENTRLKDNIIPSNSEATLESPKSQEDKDFLEKLRIAEEKIIELEEKLEDNMISQTEFDLLSVELKQLTNQKFKIEKIACDQKKILVAHVQKLEEELRSSKNTISTLHDVVKEVELLKQKELENKATITMLQQKNQELSSIVSGYETGGVAISSSGWTNVSPRQDSEIELIEGESSFSIDNRDSPAYSESVDIDAGMGKMLKSG